LDDEDENKLELDDVDLDESEIDVEKGVEDTVEINVKENGGDATSQNEDRRAIKAFPRSIKFVEFSQLAEENVAKVD
jgi:hypothetical protein